MQKAINIHSKFKELWFRIVSENQTIINIFSCTFSENNINSFHFYNLFNAYGPGLYQIICNVHGKRYIGEATNVLDRLGKHTRNLDNGVSECSELQTDWNTYGSSQFTANVICIGSAWIDRDIRLKKEKELICSYSPEEVYNLHPFLIKEKQDNYRTVCEINGVRYESINEASRKTGERDNTIRTKLKNQYPGYLIIDKIKHGYEAIIVDGKEYSSINDVVSAGLATDRFQAMRRLKSHKYKNWNYVSLEKRINKTDLI